MKTKSYFVGLVLLGLMTWSCSNKDETQASLKTSMDTGVQNLTAAMTTITASSGYQVLATTVPSGSSSAPSLVKSSTSGFMGMSRMDTINMSDIAGTYAYKAAKSQRWRHELLNFFEKTGTSNNLIVSLPESKVKKPESLFRFAPSDTTLVNNYVVDVSKYSYVFGRYLWNYTYASTISINNTEAGVLNIKSSRSKTNGYNFMSDFAFATGYDAKMVYSTGDTVLSVYNISKGATTLFEEKFTSVKEATTKNHREKEYTLTVGNVKIVREPAHGNDGLDSAKVYVGNVLQTKAKVEFIDVDKSDTTEFSIIGGHRDLNITFDDGTTSTVSQLLGSSIKDIRTMFISLRQVYFATAIVDMVAWDIIMNKNDSMKDHM